MKDRDVRLRSVPWSMIAIAGVAAATIVAWYLFVVPIGHPAYGLFNMNIDTRVYRGGALAVWEGRPLYDLPVYKIWQFTYPPFAALVLLPLAWFAEPTAQFLWNVLNVISLVAVVVIALRSLRFRVDGRFVTFTVFAVIAVSSLEPVHTTIWNGQINLVLLAIVLADLVRRSGRWASWTGVGVGVAAGIKLTPIFFVAYLLLTRRFRAAVVASATFAATVVLGLVFLGDEARRFWTGQLSQTGRIGPLDAAANQSFNGFFARLERGGWLATPSWLWIPVGMVVGLLGLYAAVRATRAGAPLLAVSLTGMTSCAVSPFSWGHHWVWVVPLLLIALAHAVDVADRRRPATWLWWLAPAGIVALTFTYWQTRFIEWPRGSGIVRRHLTFGVFRAFDPVTGRDWGEALQLIGSAAYPIVLLVTIAVTLWWTSRAERIRFNATVS